MNLTTASPVEVDTALAEIYERIYRQQHEVFRAQRHYVELREGIVKRDAGNRAYSGWTEESRDKAEAKWQAACETLQEIQSETVPYDAEFARRGGWTRAFLVVTSGKGHVHSSMHCSTCYPTTEFAWLPELSGSDEAAIVTAAGADACTVCYPSAPVETAGPRSVYSKAEKATAEEKAAQQAELDAKRAVKAAKAITDVDGGPLKGRWGTIATERTAQIEYVDALVEAARVRAYTPSDAAHATHLASLAAEYEEVAERLLAALAAKRSTTVEEQREALAGKVAAKVKAM